MSTSKTGIKGLLLSVHEDTNSNASLFVDGEVAFASAEERYTRNKFQGGFPKISVERALKFAAKSLNEVDSFVAGNRIHFLPRILPGYLPEKEHDFFSPLQKGYLYYHHILSKIPAAGDAISAINRALLNLRLRSVKPIVDHHTAHAYSAYFTSGFDSAAAISMDNMGDGYSTKVFQCSGGKCGFLWGSSAVCSPGQFYGAITQLLGFHCLMAGKTTGLAASGNPSKAYGVMEKIFGLAGNRRDFYLYPLYKSSRDGKYYKELKENFKPADIAAAAQKRLEDAVCGYVEEALKETGSENVVLAGGVFGNVRLNQKIFQLPGVKNIFVHPAMSDQGISLGAAYYYMSGEGLKPSRLRDVYWGDGFGDGEIHAALEEAGVEFSEEKDIEKRVAELLVQGKVVARFKGRMEYGPRALGNRSILYRPDDPTVNDFLNKRLKRTEFMPFAPAVLAEYAGGCFKNIEGAVDTARFMTITFDCTQAFSERCPAVVHLDNTARPQIVFEEDNPEYYRIIKLFHEKTSLPCIINTSFNMHEEPIVCTPRDAIRAFQAGNLDYLAIGRFLVGAKSFRESRSGDRSYRSGFGS